MGEGGGGESRNQRLNMQAASAAHAHHDQFVSGLLHQIRLLELEVAYLRRGGQTAHHTDGVESAVGAAGAEGEGEGGARRESRVHVKQSSPTPTSAAAASLTERLREEMHALRSELSAKSQRLESLTVENMQLQVWVRKNL